MVHAIGRAYCNLSATIQSCGLLLGIIKTPKLNRMGIETQTSRWTALAITRPIKNSYNFHQKTFLSFVFAQSVVSWNSFTSMYFLMAGNIPTMRYYTITGASWHVFVWFCAVTQSVIVGCKLLTSVLSLCS